MLKNTLPKMEIGDFINSVQPTGLLSLDDTLFEPEHNASAIDTYLRRVAETLAYGTVDELDGNDFIGRLLFLSIVSAAESYFRSILSITMEICPLAQAGAHEKAINLGGLLWHGKSGFSRSAFDNSSFAGAKELKKASREFIGFDLAPADFQTVLNDFDKICHLRHGIVHGDGLLPGRNAVQLDIPRFSHPVRITIRYSHLQEVAACVGALISLFNRKLFEIMCHRWAIEWRRRVDWDPRIQDPLFFKIWSAFVCRTELERRPDRRNARRLDCLNAVKAEYQI